MPKNIIVNDLSINSLLSNLNNNNHKTPLLQWGDKNKDDLPHTKNNGIVQKSIKNNNFIFSMPLDKILKDMEKERERNYKNISYKNIVNYLDKTSATPSRTDSLNALLESINKNFDDMQLGNISMPPPAEPSRYHRNRRRSIYRIPPTALSVPRPPPPPPPPPLKKINIQVEINSLDDILQLCKDYPIEKNVEYGIRGKKGYRK